MSLYVFEHCVEGLHDSCIRYGPPPNTVGGTRVVCGCSCHTGQDPCPSPHWKPGDADRMALYMAVEYGCDPRVDQILDGEVCSPVQHDAECELRADELGLV